MLLPDVDEKEEPHENDLCRSVLCLRLGRLRGSASRSRADLLDEHDGGYERQHRQCIHGHGLLVGAATRAGNDGDARARLPRTHAAAAARADGGCSFVVAFL
jgi:hypothetical protein